MTGGRSPKRKGYHYEKQMEAKLSRFGFKRMTMSGALGGEHSGDLRRPDGRFLTVLEVKRRKGGQKTLRRWMAQGNAQGLLLPGGREADDLVVLPLSSLAALLAEAGYGPRSTDTATSL